MRLFIIACLFSLAVAQPGSIHPDDLALIEANEFSDEQFADIQRFMTDSQVIADRRWFDISGYSSWDAYNFSQPTADRILGILARRDLFLDPARQLNNPVLTNMSPEALAALAFSQAYVEEKWDHEVHWERDPNPYFNWIHPDLLNPPNIVHFMYGDYLYRMRVEYWWGTYWSLFFTSDLELASHDTSNPPRLVGYSYPVGNQLFSQTAETVYWYADYLNYGAARYGDFAPQILDTRIQFPADSSGIDDLPSLFDAPFAAQLHRELTHPETAAFWNVMRFVHAAARQREGGASAEYPENGQPPVIALRYAIRTSQPVGSETGDISAFALLTTVYSDSILLDFTNWSGTGLIVNPVDETRSDGIHRLISERNKALLVIEQVGDENIYPNATHVAGSRGLGLHLTTQYDDPHNGDFLPYTAEEAHALVMALTTEARDYGIEASRHTLCNSPLLRASYEAYHDDWFTLTAGLC